MEFERKPKKLTTDPLSSYLKLINLVIRNQVTVWQSGKMRLMIEKRDGIDNEKSEKRR